MDIRNLCSKFRPKLRNNTKGYVVLLLVVFVPLIMLGTKLALDLMTMHDTMINTRTSGPAYRKCAEKAALAVAQNWNPGRSLDHQKRAALKVADQVYNDGVNSIGNIPELAKAVPGIQLSVNNEVIIGKGFDPIRVKTRAIPSTINQIKYLSAPKYLLLRKIYPTSWKNGSPWNLPFVAWKLADKLTSADTTYDKFDELDQEEHKSGKYVLSHFDRYQHPHQWWVRADEGYPTRDYFSIPLESAMDVLCMLTSSNTSSTDESGYSVSFAQNTTETNITYRIQSSVQDGTYTYREDENDNSVQVFVENNKIKVQTDSDIGYAVPAECNVDIVLACPTNGAACNKNNRDQNSTTSEMPYTSESEVDQINDDIKSCPVYQIGQAFRVFAKEFYHTKGVTMGLIPYSGKVSLDPDSNVTKTGTKATVYQNYYFKQTDYANQNSYQAYLRGVILYNSYGMTDNELNNGYKWNTLLTGCPIRCRAGMNIGVYDSAYLNNTGDNFIHTRDILGTNNPAVRTSNGNYGPAYFQQNSNPCYGGYANLLSMRCERNCTVYLPNPYYIIEPTADVQKIYEICGALYPFYDEYNVSNFIFIPVTWANNLWQSWTRNPQSSATNTDTSGNGGQLEIPSKMKEGRKKVLILVVNKPDWFEPHELTYLGFDNDFSELCMIESDRIDFSQNYDDTSKKFADGTPYDGTIQGPKKILKFETTSGTITRNSDTGYYECDGDGTATLSFPKKYLVKVVVESLDKIEWEQNLTCNFPALCDYGSIGVGYVKGKPNQLIVCERGDYYSSNIFSSANGEIWEQIAQVPISGILRYINNRPVYGNDIWCTLSVQDNNYLVCYSLDQGKTWNNADLGFPPEVGYLTFCNGVFQCSSMCNNCDFAKIAISKDGIHWKWKGKSDYCNFDCICYAQDKLVSILGSKKVVRESSDQGITWRENARLIDLEEVKTTLPCCAICYARGCFYTITRDGETFYSKDATAWKLGPFLDYLGGINSMAYCGNYLYVFGDNRIQFHRGTFLDSSLKFSNITAIPGTNTKECTFEGRREFYIEPSQMGGNSIDISLKNIRLISAEITNRPYTKISATCSFSGTDIKTSVKKAITMKVTPKPIPSFITFFDDNKIEDNVGTHTITAPTTFTFSGGADPSGGSINTGITYSQGKNFGHNLSNYKVRFKLDNARITSASLSNQYIRDYIGQYGRYNSGYKTLILSDGTLAKRGTNSIYSLYSTFGIEGTGVKLSTLTNARENLAKFRDKGLELGNIDWTISSQKSWGVEFNNARDPEDLHWYIRGGTGNRTIFVRGNGELFLQGVSYGSFNGWTSVPDIPPSYKLSVTSSGLIMQVYVKMGKTITLLHPWLLSEEDLDFYIDSNSNVVLGKLTSNLSTQIVAGNYVCFLGDGDLSLTADVLIPQKGSITRIAPDGNSMSMDFLTSQTITIDPDNYKYEKGDDGLYTIKLTCDNVELSELKLLDTSDVFTWDKIRRPEMSRWIDYSTNPYTANLVSTDTQFLKHWKYSTETGFYRNTTVEGNWAVMYFEGIPGDYSSITYSDSNYEIRHYRQGENDSDGTYNPYPASGLNLLYTPLYMVHNDMLKNGKFSWSKYVGTANTFNLVLQTLTLPINTALYYAYHDNSTNEAEWYTNSKGEYEYDASEASKNATLAACKKLKEDFGNNLRIYLIKYRKQTQYKHKVTSASTEYKYDYLDDCTAYKYDIDSEDDLKTTMKTISADIRTFAGYKGATNVVP